MAYNKVVYDGRTLVDLTSDTVDASVLLAGYTAHGKDGSAIVGTFDPLNMFYPVGSYYETSDTSFDPNTAWGGTWILETAGQVHVSAGTGYAVSGALTNASDGGESTVTLTTNMIPAHTHGKKNLTGGFQARHYGTGTATGYQLVFTPSGIVDIEAKTGTFGKVNIGGAGNTGGYEQVTVDASHEHTSVGGNGSHENMPPYIVVNRWHRTA